MPSQVRFGGVTGLALSMLKELVHGRFERWPALLEHRPAGILERVLGVPHHVNICMAYTNLKSPWFGHNSPNRVERL